MTAEAAEWMEEEVKVQECRYKGIVEEIDALEPQREQWTEDFLNIIQTKGFNVTGDQRRKIPKKDIPKKPDRPDALRVIW